VFQQNNNRELIQLFLSESPFCWRYHSWYSWWRKE